LPTHYIYGYGQLSINLKNITKLDKEFLAIVIGIVLAVVVMLAMMTHAVMGIEPRKWDKTPKGGNIETKIEIKQETMRNATEEELYDGGFRTKLVEDENGKTCIEKRGENIFCNK